MAKAIRFFSGTDTYGRHVEVAQSINDEWFGRSYEYNGYGKAWGKWATYEPHFETHGTNRYTGESFQYNKPQLFWGWNRLNEHTEIPRVRLPNL